MVRRGLGQVFATSNNYNGGTRVSLQRLDNVRLFLLVQHPRPHRGICRSGRRHFGPQIKAVHTEYWQEWTAIRAQTPRRGAKLGDNHGFKTQMLCAGEVQGGVSSEGI